MSEKLEGYLSLYESEDERVSTETYRLQLTNAVGFAIRSFNPNHPMRTVKDVKAAIDKVTQPAAFEYWRYNARKLQPITTREISELSGIKYNTLNGYFKKDGKRDLPLDAFADIVSACYEFIYSPARLLGETPAEWLRDCKEYPQNIPDHQKRLLIVQSLLGIGQDEALSHEEEKQKRIKEEEEHRCKQFDRCADVAYITLIASMLSEENLAWLLEAAERCAQQIEMPEEWAGSSFSTDEGETTGVKYLYKKLGKHWGEKTVKGFQKDYVRTTEKEREAGAGYRKSVIKTDVITANNYSRLLDYARKNRNLELLVLLIKALPAESAAIFSFDNASVYFEK